MIFDRSYRVSRVGISLKFSTMRFKVLGAQKYRLQLTETVVNCRFGADGTGKSTAGCHL